MKNLLKTMETLGILFSHLIFLLLFVNKLYRGLEKQITELKEAVVLPFTHKDLFKEIGIKPPKGSKINIQFSKQTTNYSYSHLINYFFIGVILYGPPGTGKTLMARACAAQTKSTFLKLAGPQLVQVCILFLNLFHQ